MQQSVKSVESLHNDSTALYNDVVEGGSASSARTIISNLEAGINNLKENWGGKDAGVQINNVITVYNGMVSVRNALAGLAADSSKIAANYREIQNSNGAGLESFGVVTFEDMVVMGEYSDSRDTIDIKPDVLAGQAKISAALNSIDDFTTQVRNLYSAIMENWTSGDNRDNAVVAYDTFIANVGKYKEVLSSATESVATAIKNYNI